MKNLRLLAKSSPSPRRLILFKMTVESIYLDFKKKYKDLPSFEDINIEFEIASVEEPFVLQNIRRQMIEKAEFYIKIINELLQPDSEITSMYECKFFQDDEKGGVYDVLKKLMFFSRFSAEVGLKADEKEEVKFISEFFKDWIKLKPSLLSIISKIKSSWDSDTELKDDLAYFG